MRLADWVAALTARGLSVHPPTAAVPVELWATLPDGRGVHFACRGTRAVLRLVPADRVGVAVPVALPTPEEFRVTAYAVRPLSAGPGRLVLGAPETEVVLDGARRFGWTGVAAARLPVAAAAAIFDDLLAEALAAVPVAA